MISEGFRVKRNVDGKFHSKQIYSSLSIKATFFFLKKKKKQKNLDFSTKISALQATKYDLEGSIAVHNSKKSTKITDLNISISFRWNFSTFNRSEDQVAAHNDSLL